MFNFCPPCELPDFESKTFPDGKRYYITPEGNKYPSVTTVIGASKAHIIQEWRNRVGHEEANRISRLASGRGTNFHTLCEKYLRGESLSGSMPDALEMFKSVKPLMDKHISDVWFQEQALYSDKLQMAGRVDLIAHWDGVLSIIDYKTSKKIKSSNDIEDYFWQETAYAIMLEERIGTPVDQIVTLMAVQDEQPLVFIEKTVDHIEGLVKAIKFYENNRSQRKN